MSTGRRDEKLILDFEARDEWSPHRIKKRRDLLNFTVGSKVGMETALVSSVFKSFGWNSEPSHLQWRAIQTGSGFTTRAEIFVEVVSSHSPLIQVELAGAGG